MTVLDQLAAAPAGSKGRGVGIDPDRHVVIYKAEPSGWELQFQNGDTTTRLLLSTEAVEATLVLLSDWYDRQPPAA